MANKPVTDKAKAFYIEIGARLKAVRLTNKKTLTDVVNDFNNLFVYQQLNKWERGTGRIPVDKLVILCNYYGLDIGEVTQAAYQVTVTK